MKEITIHNDTYRVLYTAEEIQQRVGILADLIVEDYKHATQPLLLLIVINGGMDFGIDLSRALEERNFLHSRETITATRYTGEGEANKMVSIIYKSNIIFEGRDILVVEDLVDKGDTLNALNNKIVRTSDPHSLEYAVVGTKKDHTFKVPIKYQLIEEQFPDAWIIGYGMNAIDENKIEIYRSTKEIFYKTN